MVLRNGTCAEDKHGTTVLENVVFVYQTLQRQTPEDSFLHVQGNSVLCNTTPYSPLKVIRRFGGTYRLHVQGRRISQEGKQQEAVSKQSHILL
jgi:hypothetical protein